MVPAEVRQFHGAVMRVVMEDLSTVLHGHDLTPTQISALFRLRETVGMTISELGDSLRLASSTATHLVDRLQTRGLVQRRVGDDDGRRREVHLSREGKQLLARFERSLAGSLERLLDDVPPDTLARLSEVLRTVLATLPRA